MAHYEVLKTCFVDGAKRSQAANKLGISERQMSRERTRAIRLLKAQLETPAPNATPHTRYRPEPVPAPRARSCPPPDGPWTWRTPSSTAGWSGAGRAVRGADPDPLVSLTGGAERLPRGADVRGRDYLRERRNPELAQYMAQALPSPDTALAARPALKGLADSAHLLVLDDHHVVDDDPAIAGLLEEAVLRLPDLKVITIARHRDAAGDLGASLMVPPLTLTETRELLAQLGIDAQSDMADAVHAWTEGIPHLVKLAASSGPRAGRGGAAMAVLYRPSLSWDHLRPRRSQQTA